MRRNILFFIFLLLISGCTKLTSPISPTLPVSTPTVPPSPEPTRGFLSIAIDDGWLSTYQNAFPILDVVGLKTINYIITGRFDNSEYMGRTEVLSLQSRGHEIGAHTKTHQDLTLMSPIQLDNEVRGSRQDLIAIGVRTVNSFSYPFGSYNANVIQAVRSAGFTSARTSNGGFNNRNTDKFLLARQNVGGTTTIAQIQGWINTAKQDQSWLILVIHHVDNTVSDFSITPNFFRDMIELIRSANIRVVTVSEGAQIVGS